jgi:hypothetical protein
LAHKAAEMKTDIYLNGLSLDNISNGVEMSEDEETGPAASTGDSGPGLLPFVVVVIVVVAGIGGFIAYQEFLKPDPNRVTATITVDYGNGTVLTDEITCNNNTPLGLLKTFVGEENLVESGGYVTSIYGIQTKEDVPGLEDGEERFWLFYVNGDMPLESAAVYEVVNDDVVEFRFDPSPW